MRHSQIRSFFRNWLPVLLWLMVIAVESTTLLSSERTGSFLYSVVTALFGRVDFQHFLMFHHVLRKVGHFVGYAILSLLLFRALRGTYAEYQPSDNSSDHREDDATPALSWRWSLLAILLTVVVASADEIHQMFLPSRGGAFRDVLLDTTGALIMQVVLLRMIRFRENRQSLLFSTPARPDDYGCSK